MLPLIIHRDELKYFAMIEVIMFIPRFPSHGIKGSILNNDENIS